MFDQLTQNTNSEASWTPAVEKDKGDALLLRTQLTGMDAKNLDVKVKISGHLNAQAG